MCALCLKPQWCKSFDPKTRHCKDYCTHGAKASIHWATEDHNDAPAMERLPPGTPLPSMSSILMPDEVTEIQAKLDETPKLSKKKLRRLARAQNLETSPPVMTATIGAPSVDAAGHREKVAPW